MTTFETPAVNGSGIRGICGGEHETGPSGGRDQHQQDYPLILWFYGSKGVVQGNCFGFEDDAKVENPYSGWLSWSVRCYCGKGRRGIRDDARTTPGEA